MKIFVFKFIVWRVGKNRRLVYFKLLYYVINNFGGKKFGNRKKYFYLSYLDRLMKSHVRYRSYALLFHQPASAVLPHVVCEAVMSYTKVEVPRSGVCNFNFLKKVKLGHPKKMCCRVQLRNCWEKEEDHEVFKFWFFHSSKKVADNRYSNES